MGEVIINENLKKIEKYKALIERLNVLYNQGFKEGSGINVSIWEQIENPEENEVQFRIELYDKSKQFVYFDKENFKRDILNDEEKVTEKINDLFIKANKALSISNEFNENKDKFMKSIETEEEKLSKEIKRLSDRIEVLKKRNPFDWRFGNVKMNNELWALLEDFYSLKLEEQFGKGFNVRIIIYEHHNHNHSNFKIKFETSKNGKLYYSFLREDIFLNWGENIYKEIEKLFLLTSAKLS